MAGAVTKVATKTKVGVFKRFGNYLRLVLDDYRAVARETYHDITSGSIKAAVYLSGLVALGVLHKSNPTKRDLDTVLMESAHDLSLISPAVRSVKADAFVDTMCSAKRDGRLHHTNLGIFSLVWLSEHSGELDLYSANCKHTNLPWYEFHKKVIDIGVLGKFMMLNSYMKDYDVNPDEWKSEESS